MWNHWLKYQKGHCDVLLSFLPGLEMEVLMPAGSAMEPALERGTRRKTPERRLVWWRIRLLLGCRTNTPSADLLVEELPVNEADLKNRGEGGQSERWLTSSWSVSLTSEFDLWKVSKTRFLERDQFSNIKRESKVINMRKYADKKERISRKCAKTASGHYDAPKKSLCSILPATMLHTYMSVTSTMPSAVSFTMLPQLANEIMKCCFISHQACKLLITVVQRFPAVMPTDWGYIHISQTGRSLL